MGPHDDRSAEGVGTADGLSIGMPPDPGQASLTATVQIDSACDPAKDGWKPEPVPLSAADAQPSVISCPVGYQHIAPAGSPYCAYATQLIPGEPQGREVHFWAAVCQSDDHCPTGARCPIDNGNQNCAVECTDSGDCLMGKVCTAYGDKGLLTCQCGPPDYCFLASAADLRRGQ